MKLFKQREPIKCTVKYGAYVPYLENKICQNFIYFIDEDKR